jgi:hypothetical protein
MNRSTSPVKPRNVGSSQNAIWAVRSGCSGSLTLQPGCGQLSHLSLFFPSRALHPGAGDSPNGPDDWPSARQVPAIT